MQLPITINHKQGLIEWNFVELKEQLDLQLKKFDNLVVVEEDLLEFKDIRAKLNKVSKVIDDERKRVKKEYSEPLSAFETQVKDLTLMIATVNSKIDTQIKDFEEKDKQDKLEVIKDFYNKFNEEDKNLFPLSKLFDDKWLNRSVSLKLVEKELVDKIVKCKDEVLTLKSLDETDPQLLLTLYLDRLDFMYAINEYKRIQTTKASSIVNTLTQEKSVPTPPQTHNTEFLTVSFKVTGSKEQLTRLSKFMNDQNLEWEKLV